MEAAGGAVAGLPALLDAPAEIGQSAAHVVGRPGDLGSCLVVLLLCGARHQVGTRDPLGKTGRGHAAGGGLAGPLGLADQIVVGRTAPGAGAVGGVRAVGAAVRVAVRVAALTDRAALGGRPLRSGAPALRGLRLRGLGRLRRGLLRLAALLALLLEPVGLKGVEQRRPPVTGTGRRQGLVLRLRGQAAGRLARAAELVAVPALTRGALTEVLALLGRLLLVLLRLDRLRRGGRGALKSGRANSEVAAGFCRSSAAGRGYEPVSWPGRANWPVADGSWSGRANEPVLEDWSPYPL